MSLAVGFLAEDDPDALPVARTVGDEPGYAEQMANPVAMGGLEQTFSQEGLLSTSSAASTRVTPESAIEAVAAKTGTTVKAIAAMSDDDLFGLLAEAGIGVLQRNLVLSAVEKARADKAAKRKRKKKLTVNGAHAAPEAAAQLQEVRRQLEEIRPSHEMRHSKQWQWRVKLLTHVLQVAGALCFWCVMLNFHNGGMRLLEISQGSTSKDLVNHIRHHQRIMNGAENGGLKLSLHGPFGKEELRKTWDDLPAHFAAQVDLRVWFVGSWDGEDLTVNVRDPRLDGSGHDGLLQAWYTGDHAEHIAGHFLNCPHIVDEDWLEPADPSDLDVLNKLKSWHFACFAVFSRRFDHSSSTLELQVKSGLDEDINNEVRRWRAPAMTVFVPFVFELPHTYIN